MVKKEENEKKKEEEVKVVVERGRKWGETLHLKWTKSWRESEKL